MRIAVIGGGIAGVSAAAALADLGEVFLYEAEASLGYHASGRSAAMFLENYGNDTVRALNRASLPALEALGVLSPRGILAIGLADEEAAFRDAVESLGLSEISLQEAREMVPILSSEIRFAGFLEQAFDIDTDRMLQSLARGARQFGAKFRTGEAVKALTYEGGWTVVTETRESSVDVVVNAAGAWADEVARMAGVPPVGLVAYRRSMARIPAPGGDATRYWPMLLGPGESWYAKPDAGAWIVSPAEEDPVKPMDAWADDMVLAEGLARYEAHVSRPVDRLLTNWAGLRTFAPDRHLVIGEDPGAAGFFWLAGQGGYGFQTAPAAAKLLATLIRGGTEELATSLSPARFRD